MTNAAFERRLAQEEIIHEAWSQIAADLAHRIEAMQAAGDALAAQLGLSADAADRELIEAWRKLSMAP